MSFQIKTDDTSPYSYYSDRPRPGQFGRGRMCSKENILLYVFTETCRETFLNSFRADRFQWILYYARTAEYAKRIKKFILACEDKLLRKSQERSVIHTVGAK